MKTSKLIEQLKKYSDENIVWLEVSTDHGDDLKVKFEGYDDFISIKIE